MLKSIIPLFVALLALAGCNDAATPKEGVKYKIIAETVENAAPVIEVFSLACGHCRSMETMLPEIEKLAGVDIDKVHVTFNKSAQIAAYIYYTVAIQNDGAPDAALMESLFAYVQDTGDTVTEGERKTLLTKIFATHNLTSPFELTEEQHKQVYQKLTEAEQVVTNAEIASVPAFLVQGKYLVESSAHESLEDMANTISYLAKLDGK
ncbi:thioredoxin domain-containing protein [Photobacterium alginatilyticum]|uniref:Thiol:disulfide interchange protein DsbA/DsbL n=1 Tax=Photobacterium alginatilyticum TaxID=1775171 RepID=A0ABW9YHJ4_9GAMM|nr:thioredoxin domain-containing protein [Photobacterium alginatilyticum]NBI53228.1 thiol:disulfide interchange protein DsbA/DsbL [Photobacterium alginatilyticum]